MFRERRVLLVIPALAILSLAVGCGGGKQSVTAAELGQKADQACRTERAKFRQIQATPPANATEAADQTKALVSVAESTSSTIDDLDPPEGVRSALDVYLGAREQAIDQMRRGQDAAENQDSRGYGDAQAAVVKSAPQRRRLAQSLGFKVCSASAKAI
jgi:regulator of protease activity HflC (stomatin/prohibitin superfamily)